MTVESYKGPANFPRAELCELTNQIRRTGASIPANIAEGYGWDWSAELARFLRIAMGSASELESHFILEHDINLLGTADYERLTSGVTEIKRMLTSSVKSRKADN